MTDNRNRNEQRRARELSAELGIKYTAALRMVRQEWAELQALEARPSSAPPMRGDGPVAGTAPRFRSPHPSAVPEGEGR